MPSGPLRMVDLLVRLASERAEGRLLLRSGEVEKSVYVRDGVPVYATSTAPEDKLGEILVRKGILKREDLGGALQAAWESDRPLGRILVERNLVPPELLYPVITDQTRSIILGPFAWSEGSWEFEPGERPPVDEAAYLTDSSANLVLQGVRAGLPWARVRRELREGSIRFKLTSNPRFRLQEVRLTPEESTLMGGLDGRRTLAEVAAAAGRPVEEAAPLLYALWKLQLIEEVSPPASPLAPSPEGSPPPAIEPPPLPRASVRPGWIPWAALGGVLLALAAGTALLARRSIRFRSLSAEAASLAAEGTPEGLRGSLPLWREALSIRPTDPAVRSGLADALSLLGDLDVRGGRSAQAEVALRERVALAPAPEGVWLELAGALVEQGKGDEAREILERLLRRSSEGTDRKILRQTYFLLGRAWEAMGGGTTAAQSYILALKADPDFDEAKVALERYQAPAASAEPPPTPSPGGASLLVEREVGRALRAGRRSEAIDLLRKATTSHPDEDRFHLELGRLLIEAGQTPEAMAELKLALLKNPRNPEAHYFLGVGLQSSHRPREAASEYGEYLTLDPEGPHASQVRTLLRSLHP